jgi:hypothetical protein
MQALLGFMKCDTAREDLFRLSLIQLDEAVKELPITPPNATSARTWPRSHGKHMVASGDHRKGFFVPPKWSG